MLNLLGFLNSVAFNWAILRFRGVRRCTLTENPGILEILGSLSLLIISDTISLSKLRFLSRIHKVSMHSVHSLLVLDCNFGAARSIIVRVTLLVIFIEPLLVTALVNWLIAKTLRGLKIGMTSWLLLEGLKMARPRIKLKLRRVIE